MTLEELLASLSEQISFLSNTKIPGMEREDIKQELLLMIIRDYPGHEDENQFIIGWWFKRLKWHLLNLIEHEKREPVNRAKRFDSLKNNGK